MGIVSIVALVVVMVMESNLKYSNSRGNATFSGFILVGIPCIILFIVCSITYNNAKKTKLTLTKKELYGIIHKTFSVSSISFPLDKISSINTIRWFGIIDGIMIIPFNGVPQRILFIDNGEEFRQALLNEVLD